MVSIAALAADREPLACVQHQSGADEYRMAQLQSAAVEGAANELEWRTLTTVIRPRAFCCKRPV